MSPGRKETRARPPSKARRAIPLRAGPIVPCGPINRCGATSMLASEHRRIVLTYRAWAEAELEAAPPHHRAYEAFWLPTVEAGRASAGADLAGKHQGPGLRPWAS